MRRSPLCLALVLLAFLATSAGADSASRVRAGVDVGGPAIAGASSSGGSSSSFGDPVGDCADGVVLDDGTIENGYGWVPSVVDGEYVQQFEGSQVATGRVEAVCVCWFRTFPDDSLDFDIVFYEDVDGQPADTPFARVSSSLDEVTQGLPGSRTRVDVGDIEVPDGTFYVGPRWDPSASTFFFVCADTSPTTPAVDLWFRDDRAEDWEAAVDSADPIFEDHRALFVRLEASPERAIEVPTASEIGLAALALALTAAAAWRLRAAS